MLTHAQNKWSRRSFCAQYATGAQLKMCLCLCDDSLGLEMDASWFVCKYSSMPETAAHLSTRNTVPPHKSSKCEGKRPSMWRTPAADRQSGMPSRNSSRWSRTAFSVRARCGVISELGCSIAFWSLFWQQQTFFFFDWKNIQLLSLFHTRSVRTLSRARTPFHVTYPCRLPLAADKSCLSCLPAVPHKSFDV